MAKTLILWLAAALLTGGCAGVDLQTPGSTVRTAWSSPLQALSSCDSPHEGTSEMRVVYFRTGSAPIE